MANTTINDVDIYYEVQGVGEPLLLIMGLGANATSWVLQIEEFSKHYTVITFDNRDSGRSEKMTGSYSMRQMASDAVGLLDKLSIGTAHVFGMSMGGMIAQELVLHYPDRVRSLVSLFDDVRSKIADLLLLVPRAPIWSAQPLHEIGQALKSIVGSGHVE